jgi:hypothetical protein
VCWRPAAAATRRAVPARWPCCRIAIALCRQQQRLLLCCKGAGHGSSGSSTRQQRRLLLVMMVLRRRPGCWRGAQATSGPPLQALQLQLLRAAVRCQHGRHGGLQGFRLCLGSQQCCCARHGISVALLVLVLLVVLVVLVLLVLLVLLMLQLRVDELQSRGQVEGSKAAPAIKAQVAGGLRGGQRRVDGAAGNRRQQATAARHGAGDCRTLCCACCACWCLRSLLRERRQEGVVELRRPVLLLLLLLGLGLVELHAARQARRTPACGCQHAQALCRLLKLRGQRQVPQWARTPWPWPRRPPCWRPCLRGCSGWCCWRVC